MIIYSYETNGMNRHIEIPDNGPAIETTVRDYIEDEELMDNLIIPQLCKFNNWQFEDLLNKRVIDIGMGSANCVDYLISKYKINAYGVDLDNCIKHKYLNYQEEGRLFPDTDVRELVTNYSNYFDIAYQVLYSIPFKDASEVLLAISKLLKEDGTYWVNFDKEYYQHLDSFIPKILNEIYKDIHVNNIGNRITSIIAKNPNRNPILTPMDTYYIKLTIDEYQKYKTLNEEQQDEIIKLMKKI